MPAVSICIFTNQLVVPFFFFFMAISELSAMFFSIYFQESSMPAVAKCIFTSQLVVPFFLAAFFCIYLAISVDLSTCTVAKCPANLIAPFLCNDLNISTNYCWSLWCLFIGHRFLPLVSFRKGITILFFINF